MKFKKPNFIADSTEDAKNYLKTIKEKYHFFSQSEADIIVVLGGDGFMLDVLKKYQNLNLPFYGINQGTVGFLMNQYSESNLEKRLSEAIPCKLYPLKIKSFDVNGNIKEGLAFNDVSMIRNSPRIAKIKVKVNDKTRIGDYLGDGCLISTPAGSSAYNLSLRGPVIPVGTDVLALTPISPYRPRRWRGALLNNNAKITLLSIDYKTRPVRAEADFMEFKNITKLEIELEKKKFMNVLFDPGHDMEERIITEQFNN